MQFGSCPGAPGALPHIRTRDVSSVNFAGPLWAPRPQTPHGFELGALIWSGLYCDAPTDSMFTARMLQFRGCSRPERPFLANKACWLCYAIVHASRIPPSPSQNSHFCDVHWLSGVVGLRSLLEDGKTKGTTTKKKSAKTTTTGVNIKTFAIARSGSFLQASWGHRNVRRRRRRK